MIEAFNATKMIIDTVQQCIEKVKSIDNSLTKIDDIIGDLAEKGELTCDDVNEYNEYWGKIENSTMKKTDSLERFKEDLEELCDVIGKAINKQKKSEQKKEQKKQESKKETKKPESNKEPKKEQEPKEESTTSSSYEEIPIKSATKKEQKKPEPKKEQEYEYYDEEESEVSDFDEKEKQAKATQQKKEEPKEEQKKEPAPTEIQQKNEAFFQDVMRLLTNFTSKLEFMLRKHLEIKEKKDEPEPKKEEPKKDDATSESGHTMSDIDNDTIDTISDN